MNRKYPCLELDMTAFRENVTHIMRECASIGIDTCCVIKAFDGEPAIAHALIDCGAAEFATSRLEQAEKCKLAGIETPFLLLRIPGMSELPDVVDLCETSLESEVSTLDALEQVCAEKDRTHRVILMADLGDLREGFWDKDEMVDAARHVEFDLPHLELRGVGVNLGCYGSIKPTVEKMNDLVQIARRIESVIDRKLETVSGGASSSLPLVWNKTMPEGINHLRVGEDLFIPKGPNYDPAHPDPDDALVTIHAEVLEIREKPSYPQGEFDFTGDAFGQEPAYEDIGIHTRAVIGFGRADVSDVETLVCAEPGMKILGGSSDHCLADVTQCRPLKVGDVVDFHPRYGHLVYAAARQDMRILLTEEI